MLSIVKEWIMLIRSRNDDKFVAVAVEEAEKSKLRAKLGCIAVINGKVVAKGFNHYRTFSKDGIIERTCSCHAEMDVLRKCLKQKKIRKIALYVARISCNGDLLCSAPCKRCIEKMKMFHIKTITYIDMEGEVVKQNFEDYHTEYQTSGYNAIKNNRIKCI